MIFWLAVVVAIAVVDALWRRRGGADRSGVDARDAIERSPSIPRRWLVAALVASVVLAAVGAPGLPVLAKCVGRLAMPVGLLWLVGLVALPLIAARNRRAGALVGCALMAFTLAGSEPLGEWLLRQLEGSMWERDPFEEEPFDAVFVMGGGVHDGPTGPSLGSSGDRAVLAARLYHVGRARTLIASGAHVPGLERSGDGVELTETLWRELGVPEDAIDRVGTAYNSAQEIELYAAYARERHLARVGLISSAWHLRRALRLAARHDFAPVPLPADFRGDVGWFGAYSLIPSGGGAQAVHQACWEWLGAAVGS